MAITTLAGYQSALKTRVLYSKSGNNITGPGRWASTWAYAGGTTSTGSLSIGNTTTGLVPTDATAGAVNIPDFSGDGYITGVEFYRDNTAVARSRLFDRLFHAGNFSAAVGTTTLSTQPSFSSRVPGGTDYTGLQIWAECVGSSSGNTTFYVTYTDQSGNAGHTSASITPTTGSTNSNGAMFQIPLASGDSGVSVLESFVVTGAGSSNSWNILILRPLFMFNYLRALTVYSRWMDQTGMIPIYSDSCLMSAVYIPSGNQNQFISFDLEIASA